MIPPDYFYTLQELREFPHRSLLALVELLYTELGLNKGTIPEDRDLMMFWSKETLVQEIQSCYLIWEMDYNGENL